MVSIDEVRARVQAAAQRQIQTRAERAGEVAQAFQEVTTKRTELDAATGELASAVKSALEVMNPDEFAEFAEVPKSDVQGRVPSVRLPCGKPAADERRPPKPRRPRRRQSSG